MSKGTSKVGKVFISNNTADTTLNLLNTIRCIGILGIEFRLND